MTSEQIKKTGDILSSIGQFLICSSLVTIPIMNYSHVEVNEELGIASIFLAIIGLLLSFISIKVCGMTGTDKKNYSR